MTKKSSNLTLYKILAVVLLLIFAFCLVLLSKLMVKNNDLKRELSKKEERLSWQKENLNQIKVTIKQQKSTIDSLEVELKESLDYQHEVIHDVHTAVDDWIHKKEKPFYGYNVAVFSLEIDTVITNKVGSYVEGQGFEFLGAQEIPKGKKRPRWLAFASTVFYYTDENEQLARNLAVELEQIVGHDFRVNRGTGFGVLKENFDTSFRVHLINEKGR